MERETKRDETQSQCQHQHTTRGATRKLDLQEIRPLLHFRSFISYDYKFSKSVFVETIHFGHTTLIVKISRLRIPASRN